VAFDTPLNDRQVEVLRWISHGCPDGRWTDFSFKTTAAALVSRRLVTVSKRGGVWSAAILAAGQHYLTSGQYPPGHWATKRRERPVDREAPGSPSAVARRPVAPRRNDATVSKSTTQPPSPARELVAQVIAAGGEIQCVSKDGLRAYALLVAAVNRHHLVPEGKQLTAEMGSPWGIVVIRLELEDAPYWLTTPASEVVEAGRIGRWHPALASLRERVIGRMVIGVLASMAGVEREMVKEWTALKHEAARTNGKKFGRPRKVDDAQIAMARRMKADGHTGKDIVEFLGTSRATLYRYLSDETAALSFRSLSQSAT
jgi:hypothetical protein